MYRRRHKIQIPSATTLDGRQKRGEMRVSTGKPPKLRWKPGTTVKIEGQFYEIMYAYRVEEDPHEWWFSLEERGNNPNLILDKIGMLVHLMGAGSTTPRVVYEIFRDHTAAHTFFSDIPLNADRMTISNKRLLQRKAEVVFEEMP